MEMNGQLDFRRHCLKADEKKTGKCQGWGVKKQRRRSETERIKKMNRNRRI